MCGLVGFWRYPSREGLVEGGLLDTISELTRSLVHRGPDDFGVWVDETTGIALGHQRLAVQDLSSSGHQPMMSSCGRYVLVLNGEIYNHLDLRALLGESVSPESLKERLAARTGSGDGSDLARAHRWRGTSDTETLLAAIAAWGVEKTLKRCLGMFAFCLFDKDMQTLTLARDRFGEKPLYYGWLGRGTLKTLVFASELKAIRKHPSFNNGVNRQALTNYLRFSYVPAPYSIYEGINKLEPGCLVTATRDVRYTKDFGRIKLSNRVWFSFDDLARSSIKNSIQNESYAISELEHTLAQVVQSQRISDVPLGVFLSGGVDSSIVASFLQEHSSSPIKTFTIGFDEVDFDEAPNAREVARHLGTDHTEMRVSAEMAQDVIRRLPHMYDEPFADSSQIPMHLICRAAHEKVIVALSGDAGDELFGGYNRYLWGPRIWSRVSWLPFSLRRLLGRSIRLIPVSSWNKISSLLGVSRLGEKAYKLSSTLETACSAQDFYWSLLTAWPNASELVIGSKATQLNRISSPPHLKEPLSMMYLDTITYLPDDILCKVDRAAMACGLETRVPFLDHRLVELAWRLPLSMKIRKGVGKWILRQILYKRVPEELIERPKAGFSIPVGKWLRGPLREWAEELLDPVLIKKEGYFHPEYITQTWQEHLAGSYDHTQKLWTVLMFQAWSRKQASPEE